MSNSPSAPRGHLGAVKGAAAVSSPAAAPVSPGELLAQARCAWREAKDRADKAQEDALLAEDTACQRYADYAEIMQPGFANYFRRVLKRREM